MTHHSEVEKIVEGFFQTQLGKYSAELMSEDKTRDWLRTHLTSLISRIEEGERETWSDTKLSMPEYDTQVLCALKSLNTGKIIYSVLERKERDDAVWFDGDGEIDIWNWNVVAWKPIQALPPDKPTTT